ncbi:hypothetical protein ACRFA1_22195, partial [Klebsiella pneumoniae]
GAAHSASVVVANHHKLLETREGVGEAEPVKTAAGCAGPRRHLPAVLHSTAVGASMPLKRYPETSRQSISADQYW